MAVSAAESRPYLMARLMMTSIWYRPCLRIATVISAGIPSSATMGTTAKATIVTGFCSDPVAAMPSSAASWATVNTTAATMIHLICLRTSRPPDR